MTAIPLTPSALVQVAEREIALRRSVYPGQIGRGKMKPHEMNYQISAMEKIAEILRVIRDDPELQKMLRERLEEAS